MLTRAAPAKLNLTLHITGKRADGYHELESLVVFTDLQDVVRVQAADTLTLHVEGAFADASGDGENNLVMKAAHALQAASGCTRGAALTLSKHIPVGAGLGGGSADAAAALVLLSQLWQVDADLPAIALTLGADVPMFLHAPQPLIARGIGEVLAALDVPLPPLQAVLVYPNKKLATVEVYRAYRHETRPAVAVSFDSLAQSRNDLQRAAIALCPEVAEVLLALETMLPSPVLARMTGSGACCFALYHDAAMATLSAQALAARYPQWWVRTAAIF